MGVAHVQHALIVAVKFSNKTNHNACTTCNPHDKHTVRVYDTRVLLTSVIQINGARSVLRFGAPDRLFLCRIESLNSGIL